MRPLKYDQEERSEKSKTTVGNKHTIKVTHSKLDGTCYRFPFFTAVDTEGEENKKGKVVVRKHLIVLYNTMT